MSEEFYIGYRRTAPPGLARLVRRIAQGLVSAAATVALLLALSQDEQPSGLFEFGTVRTVEGVLREHPVPMLEVSADGAVAAGRLVLVGYGKAGLPEFARGYDGARVRFAGTLVVKGPHAMIEMNDPGSFEVLSGAPTVGDASAEPRRLGEVSLLGELVDTKCWFGVMRPATGKVHRACAIRCLSGGVPPGLLVRDEAGGASVILLAGPAGEPLDYDVEWAALEVIARGALELHGDLPVLRVERLALADPR